MDIVYKATIDTCSICGQAVKQEQEQLREMALVYGHGVQA